MFYWRSNYCNHPLRLLRLLWAQRSDQAKPARQSVPRFTRFSLCRFSRIEHIRGNNIVDVFTGGATIAIFRWDSWGSYGRNDQTKLHQPGSLSIDSLGSVCADMAAPCRLLVKQLLQSSAETLEAIMGATIRPSYTSQAVWSNYNLTSIWLQSKLPSAALAHDYFYFLDSAVQITTI